MRRALLFTLAVLALFTLATVAEAAAAGCINCVYNSTLVKWECKLTQSDGGTSCTTNYGGCQISGYCRCDKENLSGNLFAQPLAVQPIACAGEAAAASASIVVPPTLLNHLAVTDPHLAIALAELSRDGRLVSPTRIYRTPFDLSTEDALSWIESGGEGPGFLAERARTAPEGAEPLVYDLHLENDPQTLAQTLVVERQGGDRLELPLRPDFLLQPDVLTLDSP